jgi:succinate dehydrogenase/fumarate reductase flavoprotein subunit
MKQIADHDILIIGGGAAGLRAAISAVEMDPSLKIAIISKVYPVRSHTVAAEGGIAAALKDYDSTEKHSYDTIKGSDYLADQHAVEFFTRRAKEEAILLEHWGCPWSRQKNGKLSARAFGGMGTKRTIHAADKSGFYLLHTLFERTLQFENITRYDEWYATKILKKDGKANGVCAIDLKNGELYAIAAKAIIIATGGAGKTYASTTNSNIKTGDGMYLALRAGAALKDMEFIQFHPTTLPVSGILITEAARGEGGHLINKDGERFLKKYIPNKMELGPRDLIVKAILKEIDEGRGIEGAHGEYVYLDLRHLGEKVINEKLSNVKETCIKFANMNPIREPIPIRPAQHYIMGGIDTNIECETAVTNLLAAGEAACVSVNGANRLGSNSLSECLVFGAEAGKKAASLCGKNKKSAMDESEIEHEEKRIRKILSSEGKESTVKLRAQMQLTMDLHAGIIRNRQFLEEGLSKIRDLKERFKNIGLTENSLVFNMELVNYFELESMLTLCETILLSALKREESRGAHFRSDFPERKDHKFLHHNVVAMESGQYNFSEKPVKITHWQPETRKY